MNAKNAILLVLLASPACWAYDPNYCPFLPGQQPAAKASPCELLGRKQSGETNLAVYTVCPGTVLAIQKTDPNGELSASLIEKEAVVGGPVALGKVRGSVRVWAANLTSKDGEGKDVIIGLPGGVKGFGPFSQPVCFFLRSKEGYTAVQGETCRLEGHDFVDLDNDGQIEWIQTEFIRGCVGRDGKAHNYWVSNLIHFRDGELLLANEIDTRFPSWIWYTYKPNHKNTIQLSVIQKHQLFVEQADGLSIYSASRVAKGK